MSAPVIQPYGGESQFIGCPAVYQITPTGSGVEGTFYRVKLKVKANLTGNDDAEFDFSNPVDVVRSGSSVSVRPATFDVSSALRAVAERWQPQPETLTYPAVTFYLEAGEIVLFAGGSGLPFFSTDTAAALRAAEIHADAILLAKNIDGVYDDDPRKNAAAVKFDSISYDEVLARRLAVMDTTATAIAMENGIPAAVFALANPVNILRVLNGENVGTIVE